MGNYFIRLFLLFIISNFIISCVPDSERMISKGMELYEKGKSSEALIHFEKGILKSSVIREFEKLKLIAYNDMFYVRDNEKVKLLYPSNVEINIPGNFSQISLYTGIKDKASGRIVFSNGKEVRLFKIDGTLLDKQVLISDKKKTIKAITLYEDKLIYYLNGNLHSYSFSKSSGHMLFKKENFLPPFKKQLYRVAFVKNNNHLAVAAGIAGTYYANIIDLSSNSLIINKLRVVSSKLQIWKSSVYFISGSTGSWKLEKLSFNNKKRKVLLKFGNLVDIDFLPSGMLFENSKGYWLADFTKGIVLLLPFSFKIIAVSGGSIAVIHDGRFYLIDSKKFILVIDSLLNKIPDLFKVHRDFPGSI